MIIQSSMIKRGAQAADKYHAQYMMLIAVFLIGITIVGIISFKKSIHGKGTKP